MPATDTGETNQKKRTKPQHTSQRCSKCDYADPGNRISQAIFRCLSFGHETNADINAAENIRHQGLEILAKAGNISLGVPPETLAVNKRIKPVSRRTRAVRRNSLSHKSSEIS